MARPARKKQAIVDNTKADMISLGIYREEFDEIIRLYAQLKESYYELLEVLNKNEDVNSRYVELTEHGSKKDTRYTVLEGMRKDILSYANSLGLTPAGLKKLREEEKEQRASPSEKVLSIIQNAKKA